MTILVHHAGRLAIYEHKPAWTNIILDFSVRKCEHSLREANVHNIKSSFVVALFSKSKTADCKAAWPNNPSAGRVCTKLVGPIKKGLGTCKILAEEMHTISLMTE